MLAERTLKKGVPTTSKRACLVARETGGRGIVRRVFGHIAKYGSVEAVGEGYAMRNNGNLQSGNCLTGAAYGAGSTLVLTRTDPGTIVAFQALVLSYGRYPGSSAQVGHACSPQ